MALEINCYRCDEELKNQGGLLFLPPTDMMSCKIHLCNKCSIEIYDEIVNERYRHIVKKMNEEL